MTSLFHDLESKNIMSKLDHSLDADPNSNYEILEQTIIESMDKNMPKTKVKFNKYKTKKSNWITYGIIKSIRYRDKLYKSLKSTNVNTEEYINRKRALSEYNNVLKKLIREAKHQYYNNEFNKHRKNIKKTWDTINNV